MAIVRFILGALGAVATTIGIVLIAIAIGLTSWIGDDEMVDLPEIHITADEGTIVARDLGLLWDDPDFGTDFGRIDLRLRTGNGSPVFAGITDRNVADSIVVTDVVAGDQGIWVVSDRGSTARVAWDVEPGDWSLVVAADDGDEIIIDGEVTAAEFRLAAITVGGIGVASAVAGGLLLVVAFTAGRRRSQPVETSVPEKEPTPV